MRVALVCPYDWARPGGVRDHVGRLAAYLRGQGDEVRIVAPLSDGADALVASAGRPIDVRFNASVAPIAPSPMAGRRTRQALEEFHPDVVHVHEPLVPAVSLAAASWPGTVVGTFHAWSDHDRLYRFVSPAARRMVRRLAARVAVSPVARRYAAEALGLPESAFEVVPNGIDVVRFAGATPLPDLAADERPVILFVGRLEPRKGLEVLVRAFLDVRRRRPGARLVVVGEGPELRRCASLVPPSAQPDVCFAGRVPDEALPRYHASADVFAAPALGGESFGIVLLEAMAAGLPVVASNIPGYAGVMDDGVQGRLVPPGDADALAASLDELLGDPEGRASMGERGRLTAARHDWAIVGARVAALYRAVS